MATEVKLPELGENVASADVLRVIISPGDTVTEGQAVLELETEKATVEVPASVSGQVAEVRVKVGDKVKVGQVLFTVEAGDAAKPAETAPTAVMEDEVAGKVESKVEDVAPATKKDQPEAKTTAKPQRAEPDRKSQARAAPARLKPEPPKAEEADEEETDSRTAAADEEEEEVQPPSRRGEVVAIGRGARQPPERPREVAPAAPSVRRLARELGVDIGRVPGSGPGGRIAPEDVKAYVRRSASGGGRAGAAGEPLPDFSRWGDVERKAMRAVRRKTAEHVSAAWTTIPHVTQHDDADITALDELRKRFEKKVEAAGGKLTVTAIILRVLASALKQFPQFNTSVDMEREEIVQKHYINIGIAVDTDRGLLVPVIRNADQKNISELSIELNELAEKARNRKVTLEDMEGGTFTITNLGGIGGTYFTPIVNAPEVAILGVSRATLRPSYRDGQLEPRLMLPLSLSYDHRVIDGADGIRFLRWIVEALEQPFLLPLQG
jgi:pyruvate dehydrogenase E2 component (dihydrolipoamide acetyltransferase)